MQHYTHLTSLLAAPPLSLFRNYTGDPLNFGSPLDFVPCSSIILI